MDQDKNLIEWDGSSRDGASDDEVATLLPGGIRVWSLAYLSNGELLSSSENTPEGRLPAPGDDTAAWDRGGHLWDVEKKTLIQAFGGLFDLAVSRDGRYFLTAHGVGGDANDFHWEKSEDGHAKVVRVLDRHSLTECFRWASDERKALFCADISPDSTLIAAGGYDHVMEGGVPKFCLRVCDWRGSQDSVILGWHGSGILDVHFSADGRYLATISEAGVVKRWDATRWNEPQEGKILWPKSPAREMAKIAFSPDSKRLATGNGLEDVVVIDVETGKLAMEPLQGHGETVICVAYSPDGQFLASAGADHTVCLWDAETGKLLHRYLGHTRVVNALAFSPDSRTLASGGRGVIKLWRVEAAWRKR